MPTLADVSPLVTFFAVSCFSLMAACVLLAVYVQFEEYRFRKSFRATFTRFHIWCLTILACLFVMSLTDIYVFVVNAHYPDVNYLDMTVVIVSSSLASSGLLATYTAYIYNRSKSVVWGGTAGIWAKRFVYVNMFLYGLILVPSAIQIGTIDNQEWVDYTTLIINCLSAVTGIIIVGLDIFYTRVFVAQVRASNTLFRSSTSEKDIIANYGLLCVGGSLAAMFSFLVFTIASYTDVSLLSTKVLAVERWCLFLTALGMVMMKQQLNKAQVARSQVNSTQKSGLKASVASKDVNQSATMSMSENTHEDSFTESKSTNAPMPGDASASKLLQSNLTGTESVSSVPERGDTMV